MARGTGGRAEMRPVISTRDNTRTTRNMVMESFSGALGANTKDSTTMMSKEDMERCTGLMAAFIEVSGRTGYRAVLD